MRERKISAGTIIRFAVLLAALINQALVTFGYSPLPIQDAQIEQLITITWTIVASIVAWWKDNDVTKRARSRIK